MNPLAQLAPSRPELPESALDLQREIRSFLADAVRDGVFEPRCDGWIFGWDRDFSRELAKRGWAGLVVPKEYGGPGLGPLHRYVIAEELLAAGAPVAAHWTADRQTAPGLVRFGSEELRRRYLPLIARGELAVAVAMSEPDAGSDLAALRTSAREVPGGWLLNGRKVWTSHGHRADILVVIARTEPLEEFRRHVGLSQFVVERTTPGVHVRPLYGLDGAHHFNEVLFDDVLVPGERLLGNRGDGWLQVTAELASERSGPDRFLSTYPVVMALHELTRDRDDTLTRDLFGRLLSRLWVLRQLSLSVAGAQDSGADASVAAALVKDIGTRLEREIIDVAAHVGSVDATGEPCPVPALLAAHLHPAADNAAGYTLRGGANEILRGVVAKAVGAR